MLCKGLKSISRYAATLIPHAQASDNKLATELISSLLPRGSVLKNNSSINIKSIYEKQKKSKKRKTKTHKKDNVKRIKIVKNIKNNTCENRCHVSQKSFLIIHAVRRIHSGVISRIKCPLSTLKCLTLRERILVQWTPCSEIAYKVIDFRVFEFSHGATLSTRPFSKYRYVLKATK